MSKKILVIGSSNIDLIMQMERIPKIGETLTNGKFIQTNGGKGANQAVAAVRAGGEVDFISALGADDFASAMLANYQADGIGTTKVLQKEGHATGTALIMIDAEGRNCIAVAPGANNELSSNDIDDAKALFETAEIILVQCEIYIDTLHYLIGLAHHLDKKIILNLAPAKSIEKSALEKVHLLVVNETEAEFLTDEKVETEEQIVSAANQLIEIVKGGVIITLGEKGAYYAIGEEKGFVPAFQVQAVDTTAAGDVYCGTLAVALVEGKAIEDAIRFASAASAIAVTKLGAQVSIPKREEVDAFLAARVT